MKPIPTTNRAALVAALALLLPGASVAAEPKAASHPPQRPLPAPLARPLTNGPAYFVDAGAGDDANDGSKAKPWRTVQHGVRRLKPGDTLYLRGGVYHETVSLTRSGTAEAPIVIASYPGELVVLDGGLREFRESPATSWEPLKGGAAGEYVSTKAYPHAADRRVPHQFLPGAWEPLWGIEDERPLALGHFADSLVPLHGYRTAADLRATNELQPKDKKAGGEGVYCGPGLWFNRETNRIHVRLAHHTLAGLGDRAYRGETDPRKLPLVVAVGFGDDVLRISGVKHVRVEGLVLRGATGSPMIHVYGSEGIHLDHLTVYGGFPALLVNASKAVRVTHSAFRGLAAPWSGRAHMKYRGTPSYQIVLQNNQPVNEDIEFAHCEFTDDHDFAFLRYAKNLRFHHNFVDNFNDDGLEFGPKLRWHTIHIHHNRIGACLGVFQQHEIDKDESPADHDRGHGRVRLPQRVRPAGRGVLHAAGRTGPDRRVPAGGGPSDQRPRQPGVPGDAGVPQHVPAARAGVPRLLPVRAGRDGSAEHRAGRVQQPVRAGREGARRGDPRQGGGPVTGRRERAVGGEGRADRRRPTPFAKFRASPLFKASREVYAPGWTTDDAVADPKFVRLAGARTRRPICG